MGMRRSLFYTLVAMSLLLALLLVGNAICAAGYNFDSSASLGSVYLGLFSGNNRSSFCLAANDFPRWSVKVYQEDYRVGKCPPGIIPDSRIYSESHELRYNLLGIRYYTGGPRHHFTTRYLAFPAYIIPFPFLVLPAIALMQYGRCRPHNQGNTCLKCGYDLRASNDRCPECGSLISPTTPLQGRGWVP